MQIKFDEFNVSFYRKDGFGDNSIENLRIYRGDLTNEDDCSLCAYLIIGGEVMTGGARPDTIETNEKNTFVLFTGGTPVYEKKMFFSSSRIEPDKLERFRLEDELEDGVLEGKTMEDVLVIPEKDNSGRHFRDTLRVHRIFPPFVYYKIHIKNKS